MSQAPAGLLQPLPVPNGKLEYWTIDIITGLPEVDGFDALLVCVDKFGKLCSRGSGGRKCSSMSSRLFMVVQFVNGLKTCRRHLLVCCNRFQYPMASLSIGPLTSSQVFLKLMGLMPC